MDDILAELKRLAASLDTPPAIAKLIEAVLRLVALQQEQCNGQGAEQSD